MVRLNPPLRQNYSIFMRNFQKKQDKISNILAYSVYVVLVIPTVRVICLYLAKSRANLGAVYRKKSKQQHQLTANIFF